jgi:hypothetical protein
LGVQRFRITQDPVATYYDNYEEEEEEEEQPVRLCPAPLRFPKVKKKRSKEPS